MDHLPLFKNLQITDQRLPNMWSGLRLGGWRDDSGTLGFVGNRTPSPDPP